MFLITFSFLKGRSYLKLASCDNFERWKEQWVQSSITFQKDVCFGAKHWLCSHGLESRSERRFGS